MDFFRGGGKSHILSHFARKTKRHFGVTLGVATGSKLLDGSQAHKAARTEALKTSKGHSEQTKRGKTGRRAKRDRRERREEEGARDTQAFVLEKHVSAIPLCKPRMAMSASATSTKFHDKL